jgi:predicted restriction endonuclease
MEEYLDLARELLDFTALNEDDPRLSISLAQGYGIVVNINRRHVLTSFWRSHSWVGFIFNPTFEQFPKMLGQAVESHQFKPHAGETLEKTPYMMRFEGSPKALLTAVQKEAWREAVFAELNRGKASPYKRWHISAAYKAITEYEYRETVLEEAFSELRGSQSLKRQRVAKVSKNEFSGLFDESQRLEAEGYFNSENLEDARQRITASIVQRRGQAEFRQKLLTAYDGKCAITGCDVEAAIEAAHIIPYQGIETNHSANGLPLRADIHTLFDLYLLTVRPDDYEVVIAPELVGTCYQKLAGQRLSLPKIKTALPDKNALTKHYATFLQKQENQ